MVNKTLPPLTVVRSSSPLLSENLFKKFDTQFLGFEKLPSHSANGICIVECSTDSFSKSEIEQLIKWLEGKRPLLISNKLHHEGYIQIINTLHPYRILNSKEFSENAVKILDKAYKASHQESPLNEKREQNTEDGMPLILENEQKMDLKLSERQKHLKSFIQFLQSLFNSHTLRDMMVTLKSELDRIKLFGNPILVYYANPIQAKIMYFQGKQLISRDANKDWPSMPHFRYNHREDQEYLASQLGRPFSKLMTIPLSYGVLEYKMPPVLYIEFLGGADQMEEASQNVLSHLQSLNIVLERMILSEQLSTTSEQWAETFDAIREPIAIIDNHYSVLRSNASFSKTLNETLCYKMFANRDTPCPNCPLDQVIKNGEPTGSEIYIGENIFEVRSYPIRLTDRHSPTAFINHYVDVTKGKILKGKMIQNEKMAALGLLAGNIAHELNNPLTGIRSMAQVLLKDPSLDQKIKDDLMEIEKASERSQAIIKNLMEFSTPESDPSHTQVSFDSVLEKTLPVLQSALKIHEISVQVEKNLLVEVEPNLMQQVIFNLLNNASQAMQTSGKIWIKGFREKNQVKIEIEDNGPGISKNIVNKIFDPFFTTKEEGEGTGLGLSVCKSILESFSGNLSLSQSARKGARFIITLPDPMRKNENTHS